MMKRLFVECVCEASTGPLSTRGPPVGGSLCRGLKQDWEVVMKAPSTVLPSLVPEMNERDGVFGRESMCFCLDVAWFEHLAIMLAVSQVTMVSIDQKLSNILFYLIT